MKSSIHLLTFIILLTFVIPTIGGISLFAQDSVRITHTQETGALEKQRFIDKYDYVFMTKEPTKWMLKGLISASYYPAITSDLGLNGIGIGYEYKLTPGWSLGSNVFFQKYQKNYRINYAVEVFSRWYYDMNRRIRSGKSANNFSGNYFGIQFNHFRDEPILEKNNSYAFFPRSWINTVGLHWGIQRRFFTHGLIDFSLSLNYYDSHYTDPVSGYNSQLYSSGLILGSNWRAGLAFGNFKKQNRLETTCDVFQCLEEEHSMLKIALPSLSLNLFTQQLRGSIAYEKKLKNSPFSLNLEYQTGLYSYSRVYNPILKKSIAGFYYQSSHWLSLDTRYYLFQKKQIRNGRSANNLSGFYGGLQVGLGYTFSPNHDLSTYWAAPIIGFQQKIFKNGFLDFRLGLPIQALSGTRYNVPISPNVSDLKFGFAF
ncbi:hypothetical protein [Runella sp.]|uniref:hypothetical protein n=1 Tax=Runella sp. TaxID=1960881 RepID=UPI003D101AAC